MELKILSVVLLSMSTSLYDFQLNTNINVMYIRVGRFWNFTLVDIGKGYWANIKPCET